MTDAASPNLTAPACRAARALLGWSLDDLAQRVGISRDSISRFEGGRPMRDGNRQTIGETFAAHGVEILNGDSPGARMRTSA